MSRDLAPTMALHHLAIRRQLLLSAMDTLRPRRRLVVLGLEARGALHDSSKGNLAGATRLVLDIGGVRLEGVEEGGDARDERVIDDALVLQGRNLEAPVVALLVDLGLLGADEGALVDVGVHLNIRVVAELQCILEAEDVNVSLALLANLGGGGGDRIEVTYPLAVVDRHFEGSCGSFPVDFSCLQI